ncbi:hypothetical protein ALI144C_06115 [Actinosynnema sp. ALI-1.44]|uniref:helix-turn-helix domain-containing protein n=1 Tax=Actinosynnema sp. ALI-1.44 TaxID=1933779 RepID=UPI00097C67A1|nr:helix-turn-helix domain-containing protein [Actinosynnema sp. ALI-1.44]ONI88608.1 hypothetical protein ALI144C_06115 [Actinosynnema sp. ALI-1.44]
MAEVSANRTLSEKLDHLFRTVRPTDGREYSYEEVASAIRKNGVDISHTYIWQLRKGKRDNPTIKHLEGLARFFGVAPVYFFDDEYAAKVDRQLELLTAMADSTVSTIAVRAGELSARAREALISMIDTVRELENPPPAQSRRRAGREDEPPVG